MRLVMLMVLACDPGPRTLTGQVVPKQEPAGAPYTLHAYEDLVQVPALVLTAKKKSYPNLGVGDFAITLDSGPPFHPSHLRLQGDDPMDVALLMDASASDARDLSY